MDTLDASSSLTSSRAAGQIGGLDATKRKTHTHTHTHTQTALVHVEGDKGLTGRMGSFGREVYLSAGGKGNFLFEFTEGVEIFLFSLEPVPVVLYTCCSSSHFFPLRKEFCLLLHSFHCAYGLFFLFLAQDQVHGLFYEEDCSSCVSLIDLI